MIKVGGFNREDFKLSETDMYEFSSRPPVNNSVWLSSVYESYTLRIYGSSTISVDESFLDEIVDT